MDYLWLLVNNRRFLQWTYPIFPLNCDIQVEHLLIQETCFSPLKSENA